MRKLKTCSVNPSHIWMADIGFCPYCNMTQDARIRGEQQQNKIDKLEKQIKKLKEK